MSPRGAYTDKANALEAEGRGSSEFRRKWSYAMSLWDTKVAEEGCLSLPGIYDSIERPERILVEAQDETGRSFQLDIDGLLAVCVQHEIDHLKGKVFVDYLSRLKQSRIKSKMRKLERETA